MRARALHSRPEGILDFEGRRLLTLACGLERLVVGLGPDRELPGGIVRRGADQPGGAGATGGPVKPDAHDGIPGHITAGRPFDTCLPLVTVGLLGVPIQHKGL